MAGESDTLYKLIILYMLNKVIFPLSNTHIASFIFGAGYTDYATIQQIIGILQDDGLILAESSRNNTSYTLTSNGKTMLEYFGHRIPEDIKKDIDNYLAENKYEMKQSANIYSEYYETTNGDFDVHCKIRENDSNLIELTVSVPDKDVAEVMSSNWRNQSQYIYDYVIKKLINSEKENPSD